MKKLKCGCKITEEGHFYSECKYHETHCHFLGCKKKLKKGDFENCKEHIFYCVGDPEGFGGSDF